MNEPLQQYEIDELEKSRRIMLASVAASITSLFIGGIALAALALVASIMGYRKLEPIVKNHAGNPMFSKFLYMAGIVCIVLSALAIAVNAIALATVYPMIAEAMRTGDYSQLAQLFGTDVSSNKGNLSSSSIW